jgi:hypothetical protein
MSLWREFAPIMFSHYWQVSKRYFLILLKKTMIVQYNTPDSSIPADIAPYPLKISWSSNRWKCSSTIFSFHPVLNYPNKITTKDFEGWTQEQGLYYPNEFDKAFTLFYLQMTKEKVLQMEPYCCSWKRILYLHRFKFIQRIAGRSAWRLPPFV